MEPNNTVVLYTSIFLGHVIPTVELAKLFVHHGVAVVVVIPTADSSSSDRDAGIARVIAGNPSIRFHVLPSTSTSDQDGFMRMLDGVRLANAHLLAFLRSLPSITALVLDLFCVDALDVADELNIPAYFYYTSAASDLAAFLHLPYFLAASTASFKDMGKTLLHFPGLPPIPASDIPHTVQDRESRSAEVRIGHYTRMPEAKGILFNTFEWLEAMAVRAIRDGVCVPGRPAPPVYCIGPLVAKGNKKAEEEKHACVTWLDAQPKRSVAFLCFGSMGAFSVAQLAEMARGLESSGQRFLWVVRAPPSEDLNKQYEAQPVTDLEALLPEGFLDRTKDKGMVVKNWAPQAEVLRHESVGAFVTHCGWNSTLEAVSAGVPMVCWPLYAEQRLNKVFMVEEMKVGMVMDGYDEEFVTAEEVTSKIRSVMQSDELRERLAAAKEKAAEAVMEGGPSRVAFAEFLRDLEN